MSNLTEDKPQPAYKPPVVTPYYEPNYYPANTGSRAGHIAFWIFYALIGFWIDLTITLTLWILAVLLPFTFPLVVLLGGSRIAELPGVVLSPGDLFYGQSDAMVYLEAGLISLLGLVLLAIAVLTLKPWLRLHQLMFRRWGGLKI